MYTPQILSKRSFPIAELVIEHSGSAWMPVAAYDELVRLRWDDLVRNTQTRVWDGTYCRVLNPCVFQSDSKTPILLGSIAYRYIATFPALSEQHASFALDPLNHLSTVVLIQTADGFYVFGVRTRNASVDLIGGGAQFDEIEIHSGADLEANICKEIYEEIGLEHADITDLAGIGILLSSTSNILIVGHARLTLNAADVERKFRQRTDEEMSQLLFVDEANVRQFLLKMSDYRALVAQLEW